MEILLFTISTLVFLEDFFEMNLKVTRASSKVLKKTDILLTLDCINWIDSRQKSVKINLQYRDA